MFSCRSWMCELHLICSACPIITCWFCVNTPARGRAQINRNCCVKDEIIKKNRTRFYPTRRGRIFVRFFLLIFVYVTPLAPLDRRLRIKWNLFFFMQLEVPFPGRDENVHTASTGWRVSNFFIYRDNDKTFWHKTLFRLKRLFIK